MLVHHSFDNRFVGELDRVRKQFGDTMMDLEGIGEKALDINHYSKHFFKKSGPTADKTIDSNANLADTSVVAWEREGYKPLLKLDALYCLWKAALEKHGIKRANKLVEGEIIGLYRIHDAHLWQKPYCFALDLQPLVMEGMPFFEGGDIGPIKHFDSYINVSMQYISFASNHLAGACALPNFMVFADFFIRKDEGERWFENEKVVKHVRQQFQSAIYSMNWPWRAGQSSFTNVTIYDDPWLHALFDKHVNPDYSGCNFENIKRLQRMFVDELILNQKRKPMTFPVMTGALLYDRTKEDFVDQEHFDYIADVSKDTGLFNFYIDADTASLSSCCRLRNSLKDAPGYANSFGVSSIGVGSHRVVTLNLPGMAYEAEDWESFKKLVAHRTDMAHDILDIHRETLMSLIERGHLPLYKYNFMQLNRQFSTVGFIGMHEALELFDIDMLKDNGHEKALEIVALLNTLNEKRAALTGYIYNVEQVPGESAAINLAQKDKLRFTDARFTMYSNQYIPLWREVDMADRLIMQGVMDRHVSGGSIAHIDLDEIVTKDQLKKLIRFAASKGVMYFAVDIAMCRCNSCGKMFTGKFEKSPCHDAPMTAYMRIVGYRTPVTSWGAARRDEYKRRQMYGAEALG